MEFYNFLESNLDLDSLKQHLTIDNLANLSASLDQVLESNENHGSIYCVWGEFKINRELLDKGVRFSLPGCPNALAWTVTKEPEEQIVFHCTIDKQSHDLDFIDSIHIFLEDLKEGLSRFQR